MARFTLLVLLAIAGLPTRKVLADVVAYTAFSRNGSASMDIDRAVGPIVTTGVPSGVLDLAASHISGDIYAFTGSGGVARSTPDGAVSTLAFSYPAGTTSGAITVLANGNLAVNRNSSASVDFLSPTGNPIATVSFTAGVLDMVASVTSGSLFAFGTDGSLYSRASSGVVSPLAFSFPSGTTTSGVVAWLPGGILAVSRNNESQITFVNELGFPLPFSASFPAGVLDLAGDVNTGELLAITLDGSIYRRAANGAITYDGFSYPSGTTSGAIAAFTPVPESSWLCCVAVPLVAICLTGRNRK